MVLNVADTVWKTSIDTVHVDAVPEHPPPDQPAKREPEAAAAVRVTDDPVV
jgi:hypothetical protein